MPYKSQAQQKFMNAAAKRGEISKKVVSEFNEASKGMKLPKKAAKKKREYKSIADLKARRKELEK